MTTEIQTAPRLVDEIITAHYDRELAEKYGKLNQLLQKEPNKEWVKDHPFAKGVKYIPIEKIEMILRQVFGKFEVKINDYKVIANSIAVHITLSVVDPMTGEMINQDGLGAMPIQLDKDSDPTDFTKIKNNAIMLALPSAESYAIKDAAEKIGKLFGADLNRKEKVYYQNIYPSLYEKGLAYQEYIAGMVENSSLAMEERPEVLEKIYSPATSIAELELIKDRLKASQIDRVTHGDGYSQTDIKNHLAKLK